MDILKEVGEASKTFNTQKFDQGKQVVWYKIEDENFPIQDFWISISIGEKEDIISGLPSNELRPKLNLPKYQGNAAKVDFGIVENNEWTFPVINKGYLFGIMGTVVKSIKDTLNEHPEIKYLLFIPASKIKSTNKVQQNKKFNLSKNPPPQENTQISDNGAQRENLYVAYLKKQLPDAVLTRENGWGVIQIKND